MADTALPRLLVPLVGTGPDVDALAAYVADSLGICELQAFASVDEALASLGPIGPEAGTYIPACIVTSSLGAIDDAIRALSDDPRFAEARFILVTTRERHDDLAWALDAGQMLSVMSHPVSTQVLVRQLARRLVRWASYRHRDDPWSQSVHVHADHLLSDGAVEFSKQLQMTSAELAAHLLAVIEEELGPRPRLDLPAGVHLTRQGWPVHGVYLILSGAVALHQSCDDGAEVLLHHASSGPLIGLNSFTRRSLAAFTSRTTTPVQAVRITMEQLERVMDKQPGIAALLAMVSLRALSDRLVRAEQLHIEKERLADQLEVEHEKSARASAEELAAARCELEEAAQFAMLGQMAAGIAHELNNPIAAITRAADHVAGDVASLVDAVPTLAGGREVLQAAREGEWLAPREQRRLTRALTEALGGDRRLAAQCVQMGITDPAAARRLGTAATPFDALTTLHTIGSSIRDIGLAARRITGLVQSLRSYSRSGDYLVTDVSVPEGIEDALRLATPQLGNLTIARHYDPDLPRITCYPSRLEQVWTNLVMNAAEAMAGGVDHPELAITVTPRGAKHVRIRFEDNGPGIPDDLLERIFLPRFTTKQGTVHYGLGMGLGICRQIIDAHGGTIRASNTDRGACLSVTLPVAGPDPAGDQPAKETDR